MLSQRMRVGKKVKISSEKSRIYRRRCIYIKARPYKS